MSAVLAKRRKSASTDGTRSSVSVEEERVAATFKITENCYTGETITNVDTSCEAIAQMLSDTIFSDATSLELLDDAVMDWIDDPFRPSFNFTPPTGASSCGCGSSFSA